MERGSKRGGGGTKRAAIVLGVAVVERIVEQRYEWRDGALPARRERWG